MVNQRGPLVVRAARHALDYLAQRKALAMLVLLAAASLCFGTYYAMDGKADASVVPTTTPPSTHSTGEASGPNASDRPLVVCAPPFTLDTGDTPTRASTRYGREGSRRIYALLNSQRTTNMKITSEEDIAHAIDLIERDQTGLYDEKTQIRVGKLLNASRLVIGEISIASVRSNNATISGQQVNTRIADVSMTVAVLDPETLERTCIRTLSGRATFVVAPGNQPPADDTLLMQAINAAINKLATDTPFIQAATAPLTPRADGLSSPNNP